MAGFLVIELARLELIFRYSLSLHLLCVRTMNILEYKIKSRIDIESISDELAGFSAAIRVTEQAIIEIAFEKSVDEKTRQRIDTVMSRLGAEPTDG